MTEQTPTTTLPPTILVIFGITGDLSKRYLMPSLYHLFKQDLLPEQFEIVGISRRDINLDDLFNKVEMCVSEENNVCDPVVMARMHSHTRVHQLDMDSPDAFKGLRQLLDDIEGQRGICMNRLYYLSVPPSGYQAIIANMGEAGLNGSCQHGNAMTRLLAEKPFGEDLASAQKLVADTAAVFQENQVYRIDHYLAKETAQNILAFRFENPLFEAVWDAEHIAAIDIVASEKIGIEGRADFYERQGALRDFVQNHLLQLLATVTMDKPVKNDSQSLHASKLALLQAIEPVAPDTVSQQSCRGQYEGYRQEVGNDASFVETYAAIRLSVNTPRWQDVPLTVRTGKSMAERYTAVSVIFKDDGRDTIPTDTSHNNVLQFRIQPNEGIQFSMFAKKPGFDNELQSVNMDFSYQHSFDGEDPTAYERVLMDAVRGDRSLFASSDEVLAAWGVVDNIVQAWTSDGSGLQSYRPGVPIDQLPLPGSGQDDRS